MRFNCLISDVSCELQVIRNSKSCLQGKSYALEVVLT
jgi:hypothetical protein